MKQLLYYGLQVLFISGILYGYYHLFLRNRRFHQYNRFYLLAVVVLSLLLPLLDIPVYFSGTEKDSSLVLEALSSLSFSGNANPVGTHRASVPGNWFTMEFMTGFVYFALAGLFLARILRSLFWLRRIIRNNPGEKIERILFIPTDEPGTPFSFFRWLFWNREIELQSPRGKQVFRHELFHIEQRHSMDIVFLELITALAWINPFFHLIKKETKAIHEFLADRFAITEQTRWQYAELLLKRALHTRQSLVNPFFHNQIKRRIAMITSSQKPGHQYLRKLMVIPLVAIAFLLVAFSYKSRKQNSMYPSGTVQEAIPVTNRLLFNDTTPSPAKPGTKPDGKTYDRVEIEPSFPGGQVKWSQYLAFSLNASVPVKNKAPNGAYTVVVIFVVHTDGHISNARTLTRHGYGMEEEALRVIKNGPDWIPATRNGQAVNAYRKQPITFIIGQPAHTSSSAESGKDLLNEVVVASLDQKVTPASFPGGEEAWKKFLAKNIRALVPVDNGAPSGSYKVIVEFRVVADGSLSDFKALTKHGYGMEEEVTRLLQNGPRWVAALKDGKKTASRVQQPVTFEVSEEPAKKSPDHPQQPRLPAISVAELKMANPFELLGLSKETEIVGYVFTTDLENGDISEVYNKGDQFNEATKKLIAGIRAGRTVSLDMITILENGKPKKMPSRVFAVTN